MINLIVLEDELKKIGKTKKDLSEYLDIDTSTLYRKLNGISEFTREEIAKTCEFINSTDPVPIFFAD